MHRMIRTEQVTFRRRPGILDRRRIFPHAAALRDCRKKASFVGRSAFHDPDIAEMDGVAVVLKTDGARIGTFGGTRAGLRHDLDVVLNDHAVLADGNPRVLRFVSEFIEAGGDEIDVIGLPRKRWKRHVEERGALLIETAAFVVGSLQSERVENLYLVSFLNVDTTVAASLAARLRHIGRTKFQMEREIAVRLFRVGARHQQMVCRDDPFAELLRVKATKEDPGPWRRRSP